MKEKQMRQAKEYGETPPDDPSEQVWKEYQKVAQEIAQKSKFWCYTCNKEQPVFVSERVIGYLYLCCRRCKRPLRLVHPDGDTRPINRPYIL